MSAEQSLDLWALVEIYGHQSIAGRVSEAVVGGCKLMRIDVPEAAGEQGFTRFFGQGAVFSVTPTTEEDARRLSVRHRAAPAAFWGQDISHPALPAPAFDLEPDDDQDDENPHIPF